MTEKKYYFVLFQSSTGWSNYKLYYVVITYSVMVFVNIFFFFLLFISPFIRYFVYKGHEYTETYIVYTLHLYINDSQSIFNRYPRNIILLLLLLTIKSLADWESENNGLPKLKIPKTNSYNIKFFWKKTIKQKQFVFKCFFLVAKTFKFHRNYI